MPAPPAGISPASCRTARCTSLPTASPSAGSWPNATDHAHLLRRRSAAEIWLLREPGADFPAEIAGDRSVYFSCEGIDPQGALWDSNAFNADFKSILLKRAAQSLLLIDKSKFNRSGEARIGHLDDVTHIVSDAPQP